MNARRNMIVKSSFAFVSFAMCGAVAMFATSCGSGGGGGGGGDVVTFDHGKAVGPMTGYAFIALGSQDTATDPLCMDDPTNTSTPPRQITAPDPNECETANKTCPETGKTVWNATDAVCISGTIPAVTSDAAFPSGDYKADWGLQIAMNSSSPPIDPNNPATGHTLGTTYSSVAFAINPDAVQPTNKAIRAIIHIVSQGCGDDPYCATIPVSGTVLKLTDFNTECWNGPACTTPTCLQLKPTDVPNIDKIGVQISSDLANQYTVTNFCLNSITFTK